jgi:aminoglycoside/choline kinase family phosphotransferase
MGPDTYDLASLLRDSYVDFTERGRRADRFFLRAPRASAKLGEFRRRSI